MAQSANAESVPRMSVTSHRVKRANDDPEGHDHDASLSRKRQKKFISNDLVVPTTGDGVPAEAVEPNITKKKRPKKKTSSFQDPVNKKSTEAPSANHTASLLGPPPLPEAEAPAVKPKKRKSVTFTPDTKQTDGNSAQDLYKEWSQLQQGGEDEFSPSEAAEFIPPAKVHPGNEPSPSAAVVNAPNAPLKKELKKAKKADRIKKKIQTEGSKDQLAYLTYLKSYHTDKTNWKFNKVQQIDLFNNAFNLWRIPHEHDEALLSYVSGLQGAAARFRLHEAAQKALEETKSQEINSKISGGDQDMDAESYRQSAAEEALRTRLANVKRRRREKAQIEKEGSAEFQKLLQKRKRAENILLALEKLGPVAPPPEKKKKQETASTLLDTEGGARERLQPRARRRKQRTGVPDDDDSSSSSSDESIPSEAEDTDSDSSVISSSSSDPSDDSSSESGDSSDSEESTSSEESSSGPSDSSSSDSDDSDN